MEMKVGIILITESNRLVFADIDRSTIFQNINHYVILSQVMYFAM
jgi:hypothetical protein